MYDASYPVKINDYIIYLFLLFYLAVDTVNGILIINYSISIAVPIKLFLLFLMIVSIGGKNLTSFSFVLFLFLITIICMLTYILKPDVNYYDSINNIFKTISIPVFFIYFYRKEINHNKSNWYYKIMNVNLTVFLFNILIGLFGLGFYTYTFSKIGIRGFFNSGNEMSALFLCLYYYVLTRAPKEKKAISIIIFIIFLAISLLITSRTSVIGCIFIFLIDFYYRVFSKKKVIFIAILPFLVFVFSVVFITVIIQTDFYQNARGQFTHHMQQGSGIVDALLTGRAQRVEPTYNLWLSNLSATQMIFGMGFTAYSGSIGSTTNSQLIRRLEIDPLETFFYYGALLFLIMMCFYLYIMKLCLKRNNKKLLFFNILFMFISWTAGHTWVSVMSGLFFACINAYELKKGVINAKN